MDFLDGIFSQVGEINLHTNVHLWWAVPCGLHLLTWGCSKVFHQQALNVITTALPQMLLPSMAHGCISFCHFLVWPELSTLYYLDGLPILPLFLPSKKVISVFWSHFFRMFGHFFWVEKRDWGCGYFWRNTSNFFVSVAYWEACWQFLKHMVQWRKDSSGESQ